MNRPVVHFLRDCVAFKRHNILGTNSLRRLAAYAVLFLVVFVFVGCRYTPVRSDRAAGPCLKRIPRDPPAFEFPTTVWQSSTTRQTKVTPAAFFDVADSGTQNTIQTTSFTQKCESPFVACPAGGDCPSRMDVVRSDLCGLLPSLVDDAKSTIDLRNAAVLSGAAGAAIAIHQDWDGEMRDYTEQHPKRWGKATDALGAIGDVPVQIPVLLTAYGCSIWTGDEALHDLTKTSINAYALTSLSTVLLKVAVNSDRPSNEWNSGDYGFPSYHTASSFCFASVLDEYYGPQVGLPAYALAGLIGWSRIDDRDHDLSDVVFGAALGYVIGKSVARNHLGDDQCVYILPYVDPCDGTAGIWLEKPF